MCFRLCAWERLNLSHRCVRRDCRTRHAVKASLVAQQIPYLYRDDVFAGTPPLAFARTLALAANRKTNATRHIGLLGITPISVRALSNRLVHRARPTSWDHVAWPMTLVVVRIVRNAQCIEALCANLLKSFEQRWVDRPKSAPRKTFLSWPCAHDQVCRCRFPR